jgi:hypothetical protein
MSSRTVNIVEEKNQVYLINHKDEIPDEEWLQIWYDSDEWAAIKASYKSVIELIESDENLDPDMISSSSRGLEAKTKFGKIAFLANSGNACSAVLDEQDRQWDAEEEHDGEAIARVYRKHSVKSASVAAAMAKNDEREAFEILGHLFQSEYLLSGADPPENQKQMSRDAVFTVVTPCH